MSQTPISLSELDYLINLKKYDAAEKLLIELFNGQMLYKLNFNQAPAGRELTKQQLDLESYQLVERLAVLLTQLLSDDKYVYSSKMLTYFLQNKRLINFTFAASSYQNTDHIIRNLGLDKKTQHTKQDILRLMVLYIPSSNIEMPWELLIKHLPAEAAQTYLGVMSCTTVLLSQKVLSTLNKLSAMAKKLPPLTVSSPQSLESMMGAYFHVSNFTGEDKYNYKKWAAKTLEKSMANFLSNDLKKQISTLSGDGVIDGKPVIVVFNEVYRPQHAMYRCWHAMISELKNRFFVIGVSEEKQLTETSELDFDKVIKFEKPYEFESYLPEIIAHNPQIVLYPSIGMSTWVPLLATQRLAPKQIMCGGHPSSSYIENVDYFFMDNLGRTAEHWNSVLSEEVLEMPAGVTKMHIREFEKVNKEYDDSVCNILINGVVQKITSDLVDVCQKITEQSQKKVKFHMFMATSKQDLEYFAMTSMIRRLIPNSVVHNYAPYSEYMGIISQCDFAIPTIPFGGANSNIDLLLLNMPKLFILDDSDISGATDYQIWSGLGYLGGLCSSVEELTNKAIELSNSRQAIESMSSELKMIDPHSFSSLESTKGDLRMVDAFERLLEC